MGRKYFGTDGVRGLANTHPMTTEMALKLGAAVGHYFGANKGSRRVLIAKDTRRSSYMLESALGAGLMSTGMNVFFFGPLPTPAVGMLTKSMRAQMGVMISASHNPYHDNGIKFFGPDGFKLSDEAEMEIESLLDQDIPLASPLEIGRARRLDDARGRYLEFAKTAFSGRKLLHGLKVVVDCANGAAYKSAPTLLWELGAEVIAMGVEPDGFNINKDCGSTHPEIAAKRVVEEGAHLGICLDGDADRVILIDEKGKVADGDQLMALIATEWASAGRLAKNTLVATVMSNMGLETYLNGKGMSLARTNVGDRYVVEEMRNNGYNLGGEQSGHIVMTDYVTTGDGLIAALQFLHVLIDSGAPASTLLNVFDPMPQKLTNVRYDASLTPLEDQHVKSAIAEGEARFGTRGRLLIRKSGTEPLIRVMGECEDEGLLTQVVGDIAAAVENA